VIGDTIGSYRILDKLGEGGMGAVYLAEHALIGRKAAIKVLLPALSGHQEIVNRFFNEARSTAQIKHAGLIDVYDFGYHTNGSAFIVMEFLEGESLATKLRRERKLGTALLCALGRQIAAALGAAHEKRIVHRDLKPDNVFLVPDAEVACGIRVKVLDFGIAKLAGAGEAAGSVKTRTGAVMGTPMYMAPEQCRGAGSVDARADIYSLGCMLFEMACGRTPFEREGIGEIIAAQIYEPPPAPRSIAKEVPPELERIILRALAKRPDERQPSMNELKRELEMLVSGETTGKHRIPETLAMGPSGTLPSGTVVAELAPRSPTTLGGAASEVVDRSLERSRRKQISGRGLAFAGASVLCVASVAWVIMGRGKPPLSPTPASVVPAQALVAPAQVPAAAAPSPSAKRVTLRVESEPAGADVYRQGDFLHVGTTPFTQNLPATPGGAVFIVRKAGFRDEQVTLSASEDGLQSVKLVRLGHPRPAPVKSATHPNATPPAPASAPKRVRDGTLDPHF
jgi:serine/threonine-protein kinase